MVYISLLFGVGFVVICLVYALYRFNRAVFTVLSLLNMLLQAKYHSLRFGNTNYNIITFLEEIVDRDPERVQFICVEDDRNVTLQFIDNYANQFYYWLRSNYPKLKPHDTIAIMINNKPEFLSLWMGIGKGGMTSALINTNIIGKALLHCVDTSTKDCEERILIIDGELKDNIPAQDIEELIKVGIKVLYYDNDMIAQINSFPTNRPNVGIRESVKERDPLMYIFTSGTTGLPKAGKISHSRFFLASMPYGTLCQLSSSDRIYTCLPLYHSAAGMLGIGAAIRYGACMVLRKKFSARNFVPDCVKYKVTSMQYIGELARYCLSAPVSSQEDEMKLISAFGNGMRADVWEKFQKRFKVKHIVEFYAATEGNLALFNATDKVGALGYVPRLFDFLYPIKLVKVHPENKQDPLRDSQTGFCHLSNADEVGLMIGIIDNKRVDRRFDGYTDASANKKKILTDVFFKNDAYFNTGDLLTRDAQGYFYWSDRVGDTFRWKGENVATTEVANVISECKDIADVTVYGVEVPGCDGKAGMAAITLKIDDLSEFQWKVLGQELKLHLPVYARPIFLRFIKNNELAMTSTFKHQKNDLVKQGFDLNNVGDDVVFVKDGETTYTQLNASIMSEILGGRRKF